MEEDRRPVEESDGETLSNGFINSLLARKLKT
jgi:hypothetical protein